MSERLDRADLLSSANRVILLLGLLCTALLLVILFLILRPEQDGDRPAAAIDPLLQEQAIAKLVAENGGLYDSHSDPDVARILQPNQQDRLVSQVSISTNGWGMRERSWQVPKPADTLRVVVLGDSFVFGFGVAAEQRFGNQLEQKLKERAVGFDGQIECLSLGVPSWNIRSETAFLRRQLSELAPDLVIHLALPNDVEDTVGVRGFGSMAVFTPQQRQRADSWISAGFPSRVLGFSRSGYLRHGLDYEGQERYRAAGGELRRLSTILGEFGVPYRLLLHYRGILAVPLQLLEPHLDPGQTIYLASAFGNDRQYWNSEQDYHWNAAGHQRVAQMLYGLIVRDQLLPQLELPQVPEAAAAVEEIAEAGRLEAESRPGPLDKVRRPGRGPTATAIDFRDLEVETAAQVHGGIDRDGMVSPYASVLLRNEEATTLRLEGSAFDRPELEGIRVRVWADDQQLGVLALQTGSKIDHRFKLPATLSSRRYLSIRLEADDYVYQGADFQHCVAFRLHRLSLAKK